MAQPKAKPKSTKKAAPEKRVTTADILKQVKRISQRLDKMEKDILKLRGVAQPQATPLEKK